MENKPTVMRLLMQTHCSNEHFDGCEYALLELDRATANKVLGLRSRYFRAGADPAPESVHFWSYEPLFFTAIGADHQDDLDDVISDMGDDEFVSAPEWLTYEYLQRQREDGEAYAERTECDRLVITKDGAWWQCVPKHTNIHVETPEFPYEVFEKALLELAPVAENAPQEGAECSPIE